MSTDPTDSNNKDLNWGRVIGDSHQTPYGDQKEFPTGFKIKGHSSGQERNEKRRRNDSESEQFGSEDNQKSSFLSVVIVGAVFLVLSSVAASFWLKSTKSHPNNSNATEITASDINSHRKIEVKSVADYDISTTKIAENFALSSSIEERLKWVRFPDEIRSRINEYTPFARDIPASIISRTGMSFDEEFNFDIFIANFEDGSQRLIAVVGTDEGLRVDWDAYALYNPVRWSEIFSGEATKTTARVFLERSSHYNYAYQDSKSWSAYLISNQNLKTPLSGYVKRGSELDQALSKSIERGRSRITLELTTTPADIKKFQMRITGIKHSDWVENRK